MAPIRKGDGTGFTPKGFAGVRKGDGTILYSAEPAIPDSAVSRLTFDDADTSGSTAVDIWGTNDGTINGATTGAVGQINESYDFDGTDDDITFSSIPDFTYPFTITAWANFDDINSYNTVWYLEPTSGIINIRTSITGNGIEFILDDGTGFNNSGTSSVSAGTWVFVSFRIDASGNFDCDIDASTVHTGNLNQIDVTDMFIGSQPSIGRHMNGRIDDPRVYDKRLTDTELTNLFDTGVISG